MQALLHTRKEDGREGGSKGKKAINNKGAALNWTGVGWWEMPSTVLFNCLYCYDYGDGDGERETEYSNDNDKNTLMHSTTQ